VDPYFPETMGWSDLEPGNIVLFSHGHFDQGVLKAPQFWKTWECFFVGPGPLIQWMRRKYKKKIPATHFLELNEGQSLNHMGLTIKAVPAHHPMTRLSKTILALHARSSAPGNPVNGYFFDGYYHSGDTVYTPRIKEALKEEKVHTACLPIGGKYQVASPAEALKIAEEIGAERLVPMKWQALMQQVPFRYQPSSLVKLAENTGTKVKIFPLAIGAVLERNSGLS
jgi:L-ascorbate metabolism protein UlaG (beta-lactamase superfamily)